ncbi:MAG: sodium-translocating pyrophosphatase [Elusimicrobiota bacterium]
MINIFGDLTSVWAAVLSGLAGLLFSAYLTLKIARKDKGSEAITQMTSAIREGMMVFLFNEYKTISFFVIAMGVALFLFVASGTAFAFIAGALCSILTGFIGARVATSSSARAAQAAGRSLDEALEILFPSCAVMGTSVAGIGLLGLSVLYLLYISGSAQAILADKIVEATNLIVGFSLGASSVALFARCGCGAYSGTKNRAAIAGNLSDSLSGVAGMGADFFESYTGAVVSVIVIAASPNPDINTKAVMMALLIAGWGVISTIAGVLFVRMNERTDPRNSLRIGVVITAAVLLTGIYLITAKWFGSKPLFFAALSGLAAGIFVGFSAELSTSGRQARKIAESAGTGTAAFIISGLAAGLGSTVVPLLLITASTIAAFHFAGILGIAFAALGMLSITGMTVAADAYGPLADEAEGLAEMVYLEPDIRNRAAKLGTSGNSLASIGKGFATGSAALTALALFTAFSQTVGLQIINALKPGVVAGFLIGGLVPFIFSAVTMGTIVKTTLLVPDDSGSPENKRTLEYAKRLGTAMSSALNEIIIPGITTILLPVLIGAVLGIEALGGFLVGSLVTGVPFAIFLSNTGSIWDNANRYVEQGNLGGAGSSTHRATEIGSLVGNPFKDFSSPSINILLKLMPVVALVFAPLIIKLHEYLKYIFIN